MLYKKASFNVSVRYFVWNFKGTLWNSTQNLLPIHWKMCTSFAGENLRAVRFKSSEVFLKWPQISCMAWWLKSNSIQDTCTMKLTKLTFKCMKVYISYSWNNIFHQAKICIIFDKLYEHHKEKKTSEFFWYGRKFSEIIWALSYA